MTQSPLLAVYARAADVEPERVQACGPALEHLIQQGRTAWPSVVLEPTWVAEHAGRVVGAVDPSHLELVHGDGLHLACGIARRHSPALEAFEVTYVARVGEYVIRLATDPSMVASVQQHLRQAVVLGLGGSPKIYEYSGRGSLGGWVRMVAIRMALNARRGATVETERISAWAERAPSAALDPELALVRAQAREAFEAAFRGALAALEARERTLLRLHYVEGLTMDQLAPMFQMSRSSVARRIDAVRRDILASTTQRLRDDLRLSPSEVKSLLAGADSQLQRNLSAFGNS